MILTYRYRLLPTKRQHRALEEILESQRELYNAAIVERIGAYLKGVRLGCFDQNRSLTEWRQCDPEAARLPMNLQRATLKRVDEAYKGFYRRLRQHGKAGLPRFRGEGRFRSFGFREFAGITLKGSRLRFKGFPGSLRVHLHRPLGSSPETMPKSCVFKRDVKGWTISLNIEVAGVLRRKVSRAVGVDLGISTLAALSDGGFIPSLRAARRGERRLRVAQRALSRAKRGSRGRHQAKTIVARCHAAIARLRAEHLHQASARLVRDYDAIVVERLNVKGLANGTLSKDVRDAGWGKFISMLRYKAERAGARLIEVDAAGSSQECSNCGARVPKDLGTRRHDCPDCGLSIDRDLNASRNVLNRAGVSPSLRNVAGVTACVQARTSGWPLIG